MSQIARLKITRRDGYTSAGWPCRRRRARARRRRPPRQQANWGIDKGARVDNAASRRFAALKYACGREVVCQTASLVRDTIRKLVSIPRGCEMQTSWGALWPPLHVHGGEGFDGESELSDGTF